MIKMEQITEMEINSAIEDYTTAITNLSWNYDSDIEVVENTRNELEKDLEVLQIQKEKLNLEETKSFIFAQIFQKNIELQIEVLK